MNKSELLLLHGWGFNRSIWLPLQKALPEYKINTPNLPGFGNTHYQSGSYQPDNIVAIMTDQITTPVTVIGWSLGGLIALLMAILAPDKVKQVILLNSNPCFVEHNHWPGVSTSFMQKFIRHFQAAPQKLLKHFSRLIAYDKNEACILTKKQDTAHKPSAWLAALQLLQNTDLSGQLHTIKVPCQFLLSTQDLLIPHHISHKITEKNPSIHCRVIKQKGHYSLLHKTNEILYALKSQQTENHTVIQ